MSSFKDVCSVVLGPLYEEFEKLCVAFQQQDVDAFLSSYYELYLPMFMRYYISSLLNPSIEEDLKLKLPAVTFVKKCLAEGDVSDLELLLSFLPDGKLDYQLVVDRLGFSLSKILKSANAKNAVRFLAGHKVACLLIFIRSVTKVSFFGLAYMYFVLFILFFFLSFQKLFGFV